MVWNGPERPQARRRWCDDRRPSDAQHARGSVEFRVWEGRKDDGGPPGRTRARAVAVRTAEDTLIHPRCFFRNDSDDTGKGIDARGSMSSRGDGRDEKGTAMATVVRRTQAVVVPRWKARKVPTERGRKRWTKPRAKRVEEEVEVVEVDEGEYVPQAGDVVEYVEEQPLNLWEKTKAAVETGIDKLPLPPTRISRTIALTAIVVLGSTFVWSVAKVVRKALTPRAKRKRKINRNRFVVETIDGFLPDRRHELDAKAIQGLGKATGFNQRELFRKYLKYLLNERKFDAQAVADVIHLKRVCGLSDMEIVEAINETGEAVFKKTGILMRTMDGMSMDGLQRKAMGRVKFSKLLYLAETDELVHSDGEAAQNMRLLDIFGATSEDAEDCRIKVLGDEPSLDALERLMGSGSYDVEGSGSGSGDGEVEQ